MTDKAEAIAKLESKYDTFRASIADLPDAAYNETWLGTWSLSQLLAHMSGWYNEMTGAIGRVGQGQPPAPAGVDYSDADSWNAKFAQDAKPGRAALADWDQYFKGYRDAAQALPDSMYGIDPEKNRPRIGDRLLEGAGMHHFDEHQEELDQWLKSRKN
ncbi:MAG: maleylpyruvate isomerase N-terminal domain-containing protein [Tepidiformaceae bacterium]